VALYDSDWEQVSHKAFDNGYSSYECALQFISLPISESLFVNFQTASSHTNENKV
jgi:hypothetical protein